MVVGSKSPLVPWLARLPPLAQLNAVWLWSEAELGALQAARVRTFAERRRAAVNQAYAERVAPAIARARELYPDGVTLAQWREALALLWSRTFALPAGPGLVPVADMFNAARNIGESSVRIESDSSEIRYYAARDIAADEDEILVFYGRDGKKSNVSVPKR